MKHVTLLHCKLKIVSQSLDITCIYHVTKVTNAWLNVASILVGNINIQFCIHIQQQFMENKLVST